MKAYIAVFLILAVANIGAFAYSNLEHSQRLEELVNIASAEATLSEKDFSMVTFNPSTNAEDRESTSCIFKGLHTHSFGYAFGLFTDYVDAFPCIPSTSFFDLLHLTFPLSSNSPSTHFSMLFDLHIFPRSFPLHMTPFPQLPFNLPLSLFFFSNPSSLRCCPL